MKKYSSDKNNYFIHYHVHLAGCAIDMRVPQKRNISYDIERLKDIRQYHSYKKYYAINLFAYKYFSKRMKLI